MKKLIAILVVLTLVTGAVFADASVGGNVRAGLQLLAGDFDDVDEGGSELGASKLQIFDMVTNVSFGNSDNGGMMRLYAKSNQWQPALFGFVYFRPIPQVRIQMGQNPDGDWGAAQISGWGFNGEAQGGVALDCHRLFGTLNRTARVRGWYTGFDALGLAVSIFPADGVAINIGIPFGSGNDTTYHHNEYPMLRNTYGQSTVNAVIGIPDVGTVRLAANFKGMDAEDAFVTPDVFASFFLIAIDDMAIDIGAAFKDDFETIELGLGFRFNAEDFGIKARFGLGLLADDTTVLGLGILPSIKMSDMTLFINAGFAMNLDTEALSWYFNPYISKAFDGVRVYAGLQLFDDSSETIRFAIPLSINVYF